MSIGSMRRTVLTWGLISGAISGGMMLATVPFAEKMGYESAESFGYATLVLSALMIFFGVRSYRENVAAGSLTFGRGFLVGAGIALVAAVLYVAVWEVAYYGFFPDFYDKFSAHMIEKAQAAGESTEKIAKVTAQAAQLKQLYAHPLANAAMTFLEPFPFGLLASLISAGLLRKK